MIERDEMKCLFRQAMDEVSGYQEYKECAEKYSEEAPMIADKYRQMSEQEMKHAHMILEMMKMSCEDAPDHEKMAYEFVIELVEDTLTKVQR